MPRGVQAPPGRYLIVRTQFDAVDCALAMMVLSTSDNFGLMEINSRRNLRKYLRRLDEHVTSRDQGDMKPTGRRRIRRTG